MINFNEWRKKSGELYVGDYKIKLDDIGGGKLLLTASSKTQLVDSNKEVKKIIDVSELGKPKMVGFSLSAPAMEPLDNRNTYTPAT